MKDSTIQSQIPSSGGSPAPLPPGHDPMFWTILAIAVLVKIILR